MKSLRANPTSAIQPKNEYKSLFLRSQKQKAGTTRSIVSVSMGSREKLFLGEVVPANACAFVARVASGEDVCGSLRVAVECLPRYGWSAQSAPAWLEIEWILGQFGDYRKTTQARYAAFVAEGKGLPSIWETLRRQIFLGSDAFINRVAQVPRAPDNMREIPRAQRRPLTQPLSHDQPTYPARRDAMAQAFRTGVYTMQEIADHFRVHYSTVSRAVRWLESIEK